ncbi:MAG: phosphoglycerate kinase [Candidatus Caldarchaeum sp.]|nr:phosphoglycerate kinase [Candidatus Caldarchaeum sp.]
MRGKNEIRFRTVDELDAAGKRIAVRVDLNSSIDPATGSVFVNERFRAHAVTVRELLDMGGKVVVLAHQGRRGDPDFTDLSQHAKIFSSFVGRDVKFVPDVVGPEAVEAIKRLSNGQAILLDNVRKIEDEDVDLPPEKHAASTIPRTLSPYLDAFVLDAFSVAHRSHSSIVGFAKLLPTYIGRVMQRELSALNSIGVAERIVLILGGNKPQECVRMLERFFRDKPEAVEHVLTGGILGQLLTKMQGYDLGPASEEILVKKKHLDLQPKLYSILERAGKRLEAPIDFAYLAADGSRVETPIQGLPCPGEIQDIGTNTIEHYRRMIEAMDTGTCVIVKGPVGVYEKPAFRKGTEALYSALRASKATTMIGGGDSVTAIDLLGFRASDFSFVSLGGGAFILYLCGEPLPGLQVLTES